ncbi:2-oxoacid:ferredoxin oxidoreductase subunit beta [Tsukamurella soli]|uniref:2-oxoacid:ferredoxin oxidoreductase subunit beta n=1 Tax=Tsukamurella soli TaxID=644556 RepID=A0ABP8JM20_9ACTN
MTAVDLGVPGRGGLEFVPGASETLKPKDFTSDQEVRWCPGCGDYAVLAAVRAFLPKLRIARENVVFVSGIGCSSRFPYYLDTYGMHSIHGRAPAIATGLAIARPELSVFVVTGDGDGLSIGGNHLVHALRRNVNLTILLLNNRIYGLTKGQYSPTSEEGKVTKSTPDGSVDHPIDPLALALGADATFVARSLDSDRVMLTSVLEAAVSHRGTSLVEIYQDCPIFNDGAFDVLRRPTDAESRVITVRHGEPITFGTPRGDGVGRWAVVQRGFGLAVAPTDEVPRESIVVHDETDRQLAFALAQLSDQALEHTVFGVIRRVVRPAYDDLVRERVEAAKGGGDDLAALLRGGDTWTVE